MNGKIQPITPCRSCADLTIRATLAEALEERTENTMEFVDQYTLDISAVLGKPLNTDLMEEAAVLMYDVQRVEDGTHEDLHTNRARTVTNEEQLAEYYGGQLTIAMNNLLDEARFTGGWVHGTGRIAPTTNHTKAA